MGRKAAVLDFRRPRPRRIVTPGPVRTDKLQFSRRRKGSAVWPVLLFTLALIPAAAVAGPDLFASAKAPPTLQPVS